MELQAYFSSTAFSSQKHLSWHRWPPDGHSLGFTEDACNASNSLIQTEREDVIHKQGRGWWHMICALWIVPVFRSIQSGQASKGTHARHKDSVSHRCFSVLLIFYCVWISLQLLLLLFEIWSSFLINLYFLFLIPIAPCQIYRWCSVTLYR